MSGPLFLKRWSLRFKIQTAHLTLFYYIIVVLVNLLSKEIRHYLRLTDGNPAFSQGGSGKMVCGNGREILFRFLKYDENTDDMWGIYKKQGVKSAVKGVRGSLQDFEQINSFCGGGEGLVGIAQKRGTRTEKRRKNSQLKKEGKAV